MASRSGGSCSARSGRRRSRTRRSASGKRSRRAASCPAATTWCPAASRRGTRAPATKPVAPATSTFIPARAPGVAADSRPGCGYAPAPPGAGPPGRAPPPASRGGGRLLARPHPAHHRHLHRPELRLRSDPASSRRAKTTSRTVFLPAADVERLVRDVRRHRLHRGPGDVVHVDEVEGLRAVPVDHRGQPAGDPLQHRVHQPEAHEGPVDVHVAQRDVGQLEGAPDGCRRASPAILEAP